MLRVSYRLLGANLLNFSESLVVVGCGNRSRRFYEKERKIHEIPTPTKHNIKVCDRINRPEHVHTFRLL